MKQLFVVAVLVGSVAAAIVSCSDSFNPPELPDLKKDPYDFAVVVPPYRDGGSDGGPVVGADMTMTGEMHDLAGTNSD